MAGVLETPAERDRCREALGLPLAVCLLRADLPVVHARLTRRHEGDDAGLRWHLARSGELAAILDASGVDLPQSGGSTRARPWSVRPSGSSRWPAGAEGLGRDDRELVVDGVQQAEHREQCVGLALGLHAVEPSGAEHPDQLRLGQRDGEGDEDSPPYPASAWISAPFDSSMR